MSKPSATASRTPLIVAGVLSTVWLVAAPVGAHYAWKEAPWYMVVVLAAMVELLVLTLWLMGNALHEPAKRWELPPNPIDAERGWRARLSGGTHALLQPLRRIGPWLRQKLRRQPQQA